MTIPRRRFLHWLAGAAALPAAPRLAIAQAYPSRPVRIVVGFPPGGAADIVARLMAQWLSDRLGQPFLVENRPGAGSNIGTETVINSAPDGYTLLLAVTSNAINATLYEKLNYNFLRDTAPVAGLMRVPHVLEVNPAIPVKTVPEFIAYAKANPGKINMASAGVGSGPHLFGDYFKMLTGIDMVHVPYRGSAPAVTDLVAGQVQAMFDLMPSSIAQIRAGRLRAIAVTTAARSEALPDVPPIADFVPGYEASSWQGVSAPKDTPTEILDRLNREINAALADPALKAKLADLGGSVLVTSRAQFGSLVANETEKWAKVVQFSGAKAN